MLYKIFSTAQQLLTILVIGLASFILWGFKAYVMAFISLSLIGILIIANIKFHNRMKRERLLLREELLEEETFTVNMINATKKQFTTPYIIIISAVFVISSISGVFIMANNNRDNINQAFCESVRSFSNDFAYNENALFLSSYIIPYDMKRMFVEVTLVVNESKLLAEKYGNISKEQRSAIADKIESDVSAFRERADNMYEPTGSIELKAFLVSILILAFVFSAHELRRILRYRYYCQLLGQKTAL